MVEPVTGLNRFRSHFASHTDKFFLIGGVASLLVSEEEGQEFRTTKDFDIVLCVESLDEEFLYAFWQFIRLGKYASHERGHIPTNYYRFRNPVDRTFPAMLELFSRVPDGVALPDSLHITPIKGADAVSSLSAILLDAEYYSWLLRGRRVIDGLPIVGADYLIPLKIRAFLDLKVQKEQGARVDTRDIRKHVRDVVRLSRLLSGNALRNVPPRVQADVVEFSKAFPVDFDFRGLKAPELNRESVLATLRSTFL